MKNKLIWIFVLLFLVSMIGVIATPVTDIAGTYITKTTLTNYDGMKILVTGSRNLLLGNLTLNTTSPSQYVQVYFYNNLSLYKNMSVTGYSAYMNITLLAGTSYYVVSYNPSGSIPYNCGVTYPILGTNINWTSGTSSATPAGLTTGEDSTCIRDIYSITTDNLAPGSIVFNPPSESGTSKYLPSNYILVNYTLNITGLTNSTLYLYNSTQLIQQIDTTNTTVFVNFTVPMTNDTYYYNVTARNTTNQSITSSTYTNYISYGSLNISVLNYTSGIINNFNVSVNSVQYNTSLGYVLVPTILGYSYPIVFNMPNYAWSYSIITIQNSSQNFSTILYPNNAINITVRNELTNAIIYTNESMSFVSDGGIVVYDSMNGSKLFTSFTADYYSIGISAINYTSRSYRYLFNNSYGNLTMYLNNGSGVIFNFKTVGGTALQGVLFKVLTYVNGSLVLVESRTSDISGKVSVSLLPNTAYFFNASLNGYTSYPLSLNPVLYGSYDIVMSPLSGGSITPSAQVTYSPTTFFSGTPNLSIYVTSSYCSLTNFSYTISWLGNSVSSYSLNPCSAYFNVPLNLTSSSYIQVFYQYSLNNGVYQNWTYTYSISQPQGNHTLVNIGQNYYGMLYGDRILVATFYVLVIMGVAFVALGVGGSLLFGAIFWLIFGQSGFVPFWILYPSLVIGVLLIISRGQNG